MKDAQKHSTKINLSFILFKLRIQNITRHHSKIFNSSVAVWTVLLFTGLCVGNILMSQTIPLLFVKVSNNDMHSVTNYLKQIRYLPEFFSEYETSVSVYGKDIQNLVYEDEIKRIQMIKKLEQLLENNQYSRDVLFGLYVLYSQSGNPQKANQYLLRAKTIDPRISN